MCSTLLLTSFNNQLSSITAKVKKCAKSYVSDIHKRSFLNESKPFVDTCDFNDTWALKCPARK